MFYKAVIWSRSNAVRTCQRLLPTTTRARCPQQKPHRGKPMKPRIYTDTSVIGGCLDREFDTPSIQLFDNFKQGKATLVFSDQTLLELKYAPARVQAVLEEVPESHKEYVELDEEADTLAQCYLIEGVIVPSKKVDAQHIAIATVNRVDVLVSWNFKHIVNLERIRGYNAVNLKLGYPLLEIRTPQEVIRYEQH